MWGWGWAAYKMRAPAALEEQMRRGGAAHGPRAATKISRGRVDGE